MLRSGGDKQGAAIQEMLRNVEMRPTRQHMVLASLLEKSGNSYVTAKSLYEKALEARCLVSRATVLSLLKTLNAKEILEFLRHLEF